MRSFITASVFCCVSVAAQAQNCHVPYIRTLENQTVDGYMTVKAGKRCSIVLRNSSGPVETTRITGGPSAGVATARGTRVTYIARSGYTGPDRFAYARTGQDRYGRSTVRTVNVNVRVVP